MAFAPAWQGWIGSQIEQLRAQDLLRTLKPLIPGHSAVDVLIAPDVLQAWTEECTPHRNLDLPSNASALKLFSSNDYMGLSSHPAVARAAADAVLRHGMGPRSSAVVGGYTFLHEELERRLADLKGTEDCLLFPTGFAANVAAVSALCSDAAVSIFSDELNHASIIDGARLASRRQGKLLVYRHNDMQHLEELLRACPKGHRKLVITDSLFSMDGDFADLQGLAMLRRQHRFLLAVDEAHATFVCGNRGAGAAEMFGVSEEVDIHIGTLSKAVGAHGGFVACRTDVKTLLLNKGRPYIFSTALAVPVVAAALAAVRVNEQEPERRKHLWELVDLLGQELGVDAQSPIVPLVLGSETSALQASAQLLQRGFYVPAIRPPTVAPGTSRLRISLSAAHSEEDVQSLVCAMRECGIIPVKAAHTPAQAFAKL